MTFATNGTMRRTAAMLGLAALTATTPLSADPLSGLAGNWSGGGSIRLDDGRSERVSCRAYYIPRGDGMGMSLRCASQSYKIELRSSIRVVGGRVTGTWEERSFNAGGSVSGSASSGALRLGFSGTMSGTMSVSYGGSSQRVSINTGGGGLSNVTLSLSKG